MALKHKILDYIEEKWMATSIVKETGIVTSTLIQLGMGTTTFDIYQREIDGHLLPSKRYGWVPPS